MKLRDYQLEDLKTIQKKFYKDGVKRQLVRHATGLGKTVLFCSLPKILKEKKKILIVLHTEELAQQAKQKMQLINPELSVGIEMGNNKALDADVVIAGVASIGRANSDRISKFDPEEFNAVVIDEAHHATADSYQRVISHFGIEQNNTLLLGVTATPNRTDGVGLYRVFDEVVADRDILWGIKNKHLSDLRGYLVTAKANLDSVSWSGSDFNQEALAKEINTKENNKKFVEAYLQNGEGRKFLAFAANIQHAKDLAEMFKAYGIKNVEAVWGEDEERQNKLADHRCGKLIGLVNNKFLTEGYDDEDIGCILVCRPIGSESLYTQIVGRGTRLSKIYNDCIVIDCTGVSQKHSLITLPNLFGLNNKMNLKGKSITKVVDDIKSKLSTKPHIAIEEIEDPEKVETYVETVDLMTVNIPPEVIQLSKLKWRKVADNHYVLWLINKEHVSIFKNSMGNWSIKGDVSGSAVDEKADSLAEAIAKGDGVVKAYGGKNYVALAKSTAKWHGDAPTSAQLNYCKVLKIKVPPNATKGEVANMITATIKKNTSNILNK